MSKSVWVKVMYVAVPVIALGVGVLIGWAIFDKPDTQAAAPAVTITQPAADAGAQPSATEQATQQASPQVPPTMTADVAAPKGATPTGGIAFGKDSAKVQVDVYYDFMCPYCGRFESANGETLVSMAEAGTIKLVEHPLSFLDRASNGAKYSTRAANAFATAANADPDAALKFATSLFENQPAEGSSGLTDDQLAQFAKQAGVPDAAVADFTKNTFEPWVAAATETALGSQTVSGTPAVFINGTQFQGDLYSAGPVEQAISQAAK